MKAELRRAYAWTCDHCGIENLANAVIRDLPPDEVKEFLARSGAVEEWEDVPSEIGIEEAITPATVSCRECGSEYEVEDDG